MWTLGLKGLMSDVDEYYCASEEDTHIIAHKLPVTCPRFILHVVAVYNLVGWFGLFALPLCLFHVV